MDSIFESSAASTAADVTNSATNASKRRRRRPLAHQAVYAPKLGLRPDEAAQVIGSEGVFRDMREAGWLEPVYARNNVLLFDYADVARAFGRLRGGERPKS